MRNLRLALSLTACALFSTACGSSPPPQVVTQIQTIKLRPPVELLDCLSEPDQPPPQFLAAGKWDRAIALYIIMWAQAHADCKAKLEALKDWNAQ